MTMKADLDILHGLSSTLEGLSQESGSLSVTGVPLTQLLPFGIGQQGSLASVVEATGIARDVHTTMCAAVTERLHEVSKAMNAVAIQFAHSDDDAAVGLADAYERATGDWKAPAR
ncbi:MULTISPECIES: hypothetical protein [Gordonia]|uniref:hypothetical protein n=1 Tax=Gordonia TaxID=2053 RepID=UPI0002A64D09|nr:MULTISPECIES: hypothetical protein [Gordonia]ATD70119.1 hypothetical protein CNO18_07420 [Gordonia sp. 1D]MDV7099181.1 hypothetical protein [Gordonia amicalis]MDV7173682.1 hypothetical protein [Gordonia amicalis]NKX79197.1 hypothetical protein [Gordonia amicalis]UKO93673.1 hypothetical protein IHQ52_10495 [Gordonia amicalis]